MTRPPLHILISRTRLVQEQHDRRINVQLRLLSEGEPNGPGLRPYSGLPTVDPVPNGSSPSPSRRAA